MTTENSAPSALPRIGRLSGRDIIGALKAGVHDFRRAPLWGLAFALPYVAIGLVLLALDAGTFLWTLALALGFPLVAPFAAVGLYEVSRRLEVNAPLDAVGILSVVANERHRQMPWVGLVLMLVFLFWSFFAHMSVALFLGPSVLLDMSTTGALLSSTRGLLMMGFQVVVGGLVAFLTFGLTVVSLPLLLEREVDVVTAMRLSLKTVSANKAFMALWAVIVAVGLALAMAPAFVGLFLVLPVLGHATWHLYRRALSDEAQP